MLCELTGRRRCKDLNLCRSTCAAAPKRGGRCAIKTSMTDVYRVHAMSKTTSIVPPLMFFFVWIAAFAFMMHAA
jgi:hypothetical protein